MTAEILIKLLYENMCGSLAEIFRLVSNCDSEYCMDQIKRHSTLQNESSFFQQNNGGFQVPTPKTFPEEDYKIDPSLLEFDSNHRVDEPSIDGTSMSSEATKRSKRAWTIQEKEELRHLQKQYHPSSIPTDILENFAKKHGRTLNSVQSWISKAKKQNKLDTDSQTLSFNSATNSNKYEFSITEMINTALSQMDNRVGTSDEIIVKIKQIFFSNQIIPNVQSMENSICQTLSSHKGIEKIKGSYGLKSSRYAIPELPQNNTMKSRLQYILTHLPNNRADLDTIRTYYWEKFNCYHQMDHDRLWEKNISKTLTQEAEFDSSNSNIKYKLKPDI